MQDLVRNTAYESSGGSPRRRDDDRCGALGSKGLELQGFGHFKVHQAYWLASIRYVMYGLIFHARFEIL
jgi:hypothetical protein